MKTVLRSAAIAGLLMAFYGSNVFAAAPADSLIARVNFVGSGALFAEPDAKKLKELWTLPSSESFRNEAVGRFAQLPAQYFGAKGTTNDAAAIRPLLEDLLAHGGYIEFRATPEFVIASRLPPARVNAWDAALRKAAGTWKFAKPATVNAEGFTGWEVKRSQPPQVLRVGRAGEWTIVAAGPEKLPLVTQLLGTIRSEGAPAKATGAWLNGDVNLSRVRGWLPVLAGFDNLPTAHFSFSNRAELVRTFVTLDFAKPHNWKAEPWRVPTNVIFDPLASFVAARGIAPVLDAIPTVHQVGWSPTPNQVVGWGLRDLPFQFYYTTPTRDVTNQLKRVAPGMPKIVFKDHSNLSGSIVQETNNWTIMWQGLPLAVPQLSALRKNPDFLLFEMFPLAVTKTPAPAELFQQLSRDNLVVYDWEITQDRIPAWRQFYQLSELATRRNLSPTNTPGARWVSDLTPKLGECVTEVTTVSPTQMIVVRKSHLGLNAFELTTLSRWIESVKFPAFGTFLPETQRSRPSRVTSPSLRK